MSTAVLLNTISTSWGLFPLARFLDGFSDDRPLELALLFGVFANFSDTLSGPGATLHDVVLSTLGPFARSLWESCDDRSIEVTLEVALGAGLSEASVVVGAAILSDSKFTEWNHGALAFSGVGDSALFEAFSRVCNNITETFCDTTINMSFSRCATYEFDLWVALALSSFWFNSWALLCKTQSQKSE